MDIELQAKLYQTYPNFFRRPRRLNSSNPNGWNVGPLDWWGIECGNGWYKLIDNLVRQYEEHIQQLIAQGVPKRSWPRALQAKEKLAGLRVYVSNARRLPASLIESKEQAEAASMVTCETCGQPGVRRTAGYLYVACDDCCRARRVATSTDLNDYLQRLRAVLAARSV